MYADQCVNNCSFVGGEAAAMFALFFALALLATGPRRNRLILLGLAAGALAGFIRMAQGGHFLSDIVFAGCSWLWSRAACTGWSWSALRLSSPMAVRRRPVLARRPWACMIWRAGQGAASELAPSAGRFAWRMEPGARRPGGGHAAVDLTVEATSSGICHHFASR